MSAFPRVLSPLVSHCTPSCLPLLDCASAFPRLLSPLCFPLYTSCFPLLDSPFVSHCAPSCFPLLDGVSGLLTSCLRLPPIVSHCFPTCVPGWCARGLVSPSLPLSPLSPMPPRTCACVGWCVRLFDVLSSLFVPHCLATCVPVLDGILSCLPVLEGVSAFPRSCLPLSPIEPIVFNLPIGACVGRCLRLGSYPPSRGLVSHVSRCLPTRVALDAVPAFPRSCLLFVSHGFPTCVPATFCVGWCFSLPAVLSPP